MRLTRRGKRRLLIVIGVALVPVIGIAALVGLRDVYRGQRVEESRERGLASYAQRQYEETLNHLAYTLSRDPEDVECLLAFADSRSQVFKVNNRHLVDAAQFYHAVLKIDPSSQQALTGLLDIYRRLGYRTEAVGIADRIIAISPDHEEAWAVKATHAYNEQRFVEVEAICDRMSGLRPQAMIWRALQVRAMLSRNAPSTEIVQLCDDWIARHEMDGRFRLFKAQVLSDFGRQAEARQVLAGACSLGADSQEVLALMVGLLDRLDMRSEADELVARSKSRFAGREWVFEAAIHRQWQANRPVLALEELAEAQRQLPPGAVGLVRWRALLLASVGRSAEASQAIEDLLQIASTGDPARREGAKAWAEALKARLEIEQTGWLAAAEALDRAIVLDPADAVLLFLLAEAFQRIGEHETALMILARAQEQDANWLSLQAARGESLLAIGNAPEAFREFSSIIRRSPDVPAGIYLRLARAWLNLGDQGKGLRLRDVGTNREYELVGLLESLHGSLGWNSEATALLVEAQHKRGSVEAAAQLVEQACREPIETGNLLALADVCRQWLPDREEQVLAVARQRAGLTPEVAIAQARLLNRRGELDQAVALLDEARRGANSSDDALAWEGAWLMFRGDRPDSVAGLLGQIATSRSPHALHALLSEPKAWDHQEIVKATVDQLKVLHGGRSPRTLLAEARYIHRFRAGDAEANAEAIKLTRSVLEVVPDSSAALGLMAALLVAGDDPQPIEAIEHLRRAAAAHPEDWGVYAPLVQLLQDQGEFDLALTHLEAMETHADGKVERHRTIAALAERQGDFDRALANLRMIGDAGSGEDAVGIARLYYRTGQLEAADKAFDGLLSGASLNDAALFAAATYYGSRGQVERGLALLDQALDGRNAAIAAMCRARLYVQAGALNEAQAELANAVQLEPGNPNAWSELARVQVASGAILDARHSAQTAVKLAPDDEAIKATLAMIAASLTTPEQQRLRAELGPLGDIHPAIQRILNVRAAAANPREHDLAEASRLVRDYPRMLAAWRVAVEIYVAARQWEHAVALAKQAVPRFPADPAPAEMATRLLIEVGRPDEALAMAGAWRRLSLADAIDADFVIAALLLDLKRPHQARDQIEQHADRILREEDRGGNRVRVWLACLLSDGEPDRAAAIVEVFLEDYQRWSQGVGLISALPPDHCRRLLEEAKAQAPTTPAASIYLAVAFRSAGTRLQDAALLQQAQEIAANVESPPEARQAAIVVRGGIAADLGDLVAAEALYREALANKPDDVIVLNNLAELLVRNDDRSDCDEAVRLASQAMDKAGSDPAVLDTLAQALLCAGDLNAAEQRIQAALARQPGNPAFVVTLAAVRHAQGRTTDARNELDHARALTAGRSDAALRQRIENLARRLDDLT